MSFIGRILVIDLMPETVTSTFAYIKKYILFINYLFKMYFLKATNPAISDVGTYEDSVNFL